VGRARRFHRLEFAARSAAYGPRAEVESAEGFLHFQALYEFLHKHYPSDLLQKDLPRRVAVTPPVVGLEADQHEVLPVADALA